MKMTFFNHLYAAAAAQVLVSQQEPHICLKTPDVSYIFASTMDLCGLLVIFVVFTNHSLSSNS